MDFNYKQPFLLILWTLATTFSFAQSQLVPSLVNESIFPLQEKHTHAGSIVALPGGDLLTVWFEGSGERKADDVLLMGSRKKQGETNWSKLIMGTYQERRGYAQTLDEATVRVPWNV